MTKSTTKYNDKQRQHINNWRENNKDTYNEYQREYRAKRSNELKRLRKIEADLKALDLLTDLGELDFEKLAKLGGTK